MSTIRLAIADENQIYTKALSEYLQSEYGQAFEISCYSSINSLSDYLCNNYDADILLVDQKLYDDCLESYKVKTIMILADNCQEHEINGMPAIYKYQAADKLAKLIIHSFDSLESKKFNVHAMQGTTKQIAVFSAAGGSGKSTIAYSICHQYAIQGKKALFVSMESYAALPIFRSDSKNRGLSYLLYLIKNKSNNLQVKLDSIKEIDASTNVHYIPREYNSLDYKDTEKAEITLLLEFLKNQSGYDAVIFDMDSSLSEKVLSVFNDCDLIVNVIGSDVASVEKNKSFITQMKIINELLNIDLATKIITVKNKVLTPLNEKILDFEENGYLINIPFIQENLYGENVYYPEFVHFKQLYDAIEKRFIDKRLEV